MQFLILLAYLMTTVMSLPILSKRVYQPTSPSFSLIAHHKGAIFQYNLVKFDGEQLLLAADEQAFFGTIRANGGYTLNIPNPKNLENVTSPSTTSVLVNGKSQLVVANTSSVASPDFGIEKSLLTYQNSTKFVACPEIGYRGEYGVYFLGENGNSTEICPQKSQGYEITLMVQLDSYVDFNPQTNKNTFLKKFKRFLKLSN